MTPSTFDVDIDGIGRFVFRRQQIRDAIRIEAEACRILGGSSNDPAIADYVYTARCVATLAVLTVTAPDGWTLDGVDPLEPDTIATLYRVYEGFREKENSFRGRPAA